MTSLHCKAVFRSFACCKFSVPKELVGASGFEPPSSWSRTSLDQAKSVELTAFACAFPRLIWATCYKVPAAGFQAVRRRACTSRPDDGAYPLIVFDPIPRIDSVQPSNDSLLELCAAVYLLSGRRGRHAAG
jgi:hypothetical protein